MNGRIDPFAREPFIRFHGPTGYTEYGRYKAWLRDDFAFRCVYCLWRERWMHRQSKDFQIEHLRPKSSEPALEFHYPNLAYACPRCNSLRGVEPIPDPTAVSYNSLLSIGDDGRF